MPNFISRRLEAVKQLRKPPTFKHPFDIYADPDYSPPPPDGVTVRHYDAMELSRVGRGPLSEAQKAGVQAEAQLAAQRRLQRLRESL